MADKRALTILVVDDNPPTRYSTSRVLRSAGFEVVEAATGREALLKASRNPDLIILDVNLPDIDGFEICRILRSTTLTARTPVIHLSATFVNDVAKVQGLEAGADGYLTHPIEPPVLIATVNAFLRTRLAEEAMRASEAKFKAVFDNALNGIALLTTDMTYVEANPALCRTLGRDRDAIVGRHVGAFLAPESAGELAVVTKEIDLSGAWRGSLPVLDASGQRVDLEWSVSIHSMPDTRLAITTDMTERRLIEADRERLLSSERAARSDAERANRLKDEFLAALSHELRTPLSAILGWSDVLKHRLPSTDPDIAKALEAIDRNARVQTQLISDLLDVSRITSGKLSLDLEWFDAPTALDTALTAFAATARKKEVGIDVVHEGTGGDLYWDPARFQQVVWNLTDNALKFSEPGSRIEVRLRVTDDAMDLSVRDDGRGIAPEFLPHIFERFRQEDASTKRRHGGLGLGLAIVKEVVDAHGATITAASDGEHHGATFTVHMPRLQRQPSTPHHRSVNPHDLRGARILVVDDDPDARDLIARLLGEARAVVRVAADVPSAIALMHRERPDLVISDLGMPGEDGYDFIRQLRHETGAAAIPAIALTAFVGDEDRQRALEAGYQYHLGKPLDTRKLIEAAARLLSQPAG